MVSNRTLGLSIDLAKYVISMIILAYAWYLIAVIIQTGVPLQSVVVLEETQQIYLYYMILGTIAALYYSYAYILDKPIAPAYEHFFDKEDLYLTIFFITIFIIGWMFSLFNNGLPPIVSTLYAVPLAIVEGVMGLVENMFFIGMIGFGLHDLLQHNSKATIISAAIVGAIASVWHLFMYVSVYKALGLLAVLPVAISVFIFFSIGTLISLVRTNTWVWDIVHFTVNFGVGLLGAHGFMII